MSTTGTLTGTFSDTSDNEGVSSWSNVRSPGGSSTHARWEIPSGTIINESTDPGPSGEINHFNTDRTADELNNPASCRLSIRGASGASYASPYVRVVLLTTKSCSFSESSHPHMIVSDVDFTGDEGIPVFEAIGSEDLDGASIIIHNIPTGTFKSAISTCIGVPKLVDYEDGSSVQYKLTNTTEDSGWLDANVVSSFTAFTSEPTKCIVKLVPKSASPTPGFPSISGFCVYGDKK